MTQKSTWVALTISLFALFCWGGVTPALAQGAKAYVDLSRVGTANALLHDAQWHRSEQDNARDAVRSGRVISPGQAKGAALSHYPGKFLDMSFGGRAYYVKIRMPDNRIVLVTVDAASGRVLGAR